MGGIGAHHAAADHHNGARIDAGNPSQQDARAALGHLQVLGALLNGHAPSHLAHGGEQRQGAIGALDGFVSDVDALAFHQHAGQLAGSRQVKIGEDNLVLADQVVLRRQGFFDVHHHLRPGKDLLRGIYDGRTCLAVARIRETASQPGTFFHQHGVAMLLHYLHASGRHGYTIFLRFNLLENADDHCHLQLVRGLLNRFFGWIPLPLFKPSISNPGCRVQLQLCDHPVSIFRSHMPSKPRRRRTTSPVRGFCPHFSRCGSMSP